MDAKTLVVVVLVIAVGVLGYLYYDSQQRVLDIKAPGFGLEAR